MIRVVLSYLVVGFLVSTRGQFAYTFERDPHVQSDRPMSRAGGIGEEKPADDESKDIATKVWMDISTGCTILLGYHCFVRFCLM